MIKKKDNNYNDFDDEDDDSDDNEDEQFDVERNIIDNNGEDENFGNDEEKGIPEIVNIELSQKDYNLEYLKYINITYVQRFMAFILLIQRIFNHLRKRIAILNVYLFAKSCNIRRNDGDNF